jgi:hypothetical protein
LNVGARELFELAASKSDYDKALQYLGSEHVAASVVELAEEWMLDTDELRAVLREPVGARVSPEFPCPAR